MVTSLSERIRDFLAAGPWVVVGASTNRAKYGNKVLRCYLQNGKRPVYAINPRASQIEGVACYPDLAALPEPARAVSIITPPAITEGVVDDALRLGIGRLWMQPGAESALAIERAEAGGIDVISGGPCLLVALGYRE